MTLHKCICVGRHCDEYIVYCPHGCYININNVGEEKVIGGCFNPKSTCIPENGLCDFLKSSYCCCTGDLCNVPGNTRFHDPLNAYSSYPLKRKISFIIWPTVLIILLVSIIFIFVFKRAVKKKRMGRESLSFPFTDDKNQKEIELGNTYVNQPGIENASAYCSVDNQLGRGRYGKIWHGTLTQSNQSKEVAIKVFQSFDKKSWENELKMYRYNFMKHPYLLGFIGFDTVEKSQGEINGLTQNLKEYWIVTEYQKNGSCYDYLKRNVLSLKQMLNISICISQGLSYLHSEVLFPTGPDNQSKPSIVHRDLKSSNILIMKDGNSACIADFGFSIIFETGQSIGETHFQVGTRRYMAPEVIDGAIQFSRESFMRIDVYALAMVLWELLWRTKTTSSDMSHDEVEEYLLPFEKELSDTSSMDMLHNLILINKARPKGKAWWNDSAIFKNIWETIQQSWDHDAEARLSAGCISERFQSFIDELCIHQQNPSQNIINV